MQKNTEDKGFFAGLFEAVTLLFLTLWRWIKRAFWGVNRELMSFFSSNGEEAESPTKARFRLFFKRKTAVLALCLLISIFLFVFIAPLFFEINLNYTDSLEANIAPNYSMLNVPKKLKNSVKTISSFSNFSVGVSREGDFYIWGYTKNSLNETDLKNVPEEIKNSKIYTASAGDDHVIAVSTDGKIIAWGDNTRAQYGKDASGEGLIFMPELLYGRLDVDKIGQLVSGYQVTALVYDGKLYMWGNANALINMESMIESSRLRYEEDGVAVKSVALSNYYGLILYEDGTVDSPANLTDKTSVTSNKNGKTKFSAIKNAVDISATNNCFAVLSEDGEIFVQGSGEYGEKEFADIPADEKPVSIESGTRHFVVTTDKGRAYSWGHNDFGQTEINGKSASVAFAGAKQSYLADKNGKITAKAGLRGYIFGTDKLGRDIFTRIVHGGKMTMTVGAVAVIVSTVIAVIIGLLSGYFGSWVDILLMRITEIFSAIPFLPFAMMLSFIIQKYPVGETARIVMIMIILGLLSWTGLARIIRGQVLAEREKEFVMSAKAMGIRERRIAFFHILPNVISVILVSITLDFSACLLTESSLSYLGFGVQLPRPTWGNMLSGANNSIIIQNYWWQWAFPAIFLSLATISINIIGDALRDVFDPKSNRES